MNRILATLTAFALLAGHASAATHTVYWTADAGETLYAFPASQSLANWSTGGSGSGYRILLDDPAAPNLGRYTGTLDDANGYEWFVFSGASQPTDWGDAIGAIDLTPATRASQASVDGIGAAEPDDRDLEPVGHVWKLRRAGDGTLRSTNPLYVVTGTAQTIRAGWDCDLPAILAPGTVISTQNTPTEVEATTNFSLTAIGHGEKVAKVQISVAADATPVAAGHWIKTTITNTNGGGPIAVYGQVIVQAEPE